MSDIKETMKDSVKEDKVETKTETKVDSKVDTKVETKPEPKVEKVKPVETTSVQADWETTVEHLRRQGQIGKFDDVEVVLRVRPNSPTSWEASLPLFAARAKTMLVK